MMLNVARKYSPTPLHHNQLPEQVGWIHTFIANSEPTV